MGATLFDNKPCADTSGGGGGRGRSAADGGYCRYQHCSQQDSENAICILYNFHFSPLVIAAAACERPTGLAVARLKIVIERVRLLTGFPVTRRPPAVASWTSARGSRLSPTALYAQTRLRLFLRLFFFRFVGPAISSVTSIGDLAPWPTRICCKSRWNARPRWTSSNRWRTSYRRTTARPTTPTTIPLRSTTCRNSAPKRCGRCATNMTARWNRSTSEHHFGVCRLVVIAVFVGYWNDLNGFSVTTIS